jgi:membrane dipeptidase
MMQMAGATDFGASAIHRRAVVVDAHQDIPLDVSAKRRMGAKGVIGKDWAPRLRAGGIDVQTFSVYVDAPYLPELALRETLRMVEAVRADLEEGPSEVEFATSVSHIDRIVAAGKIAALLSIEGFEAMGNDLDLMHTFYRLGVRMIAMTWNRRTAFGDGILETATGGGLTTLGFDAVREMNRLGILLDLSHLSRPGFFDALKTTQQVVIASHSNAQAICDHPRNLSDDQIRALAEAGGVMGLLLLPSMIDPKNANVSRAVDHIAYVADLVGIDHIGLGTDFSDDYSTLIGNTLRTQSMLPPELIDARVKDAGRIEEMPNLTAEMLRRGFAEADVLKVLGENHLRVMREVWG